MERARLVIYDPRVPESQIRSELRSALSDSTGIISEKNQKLIDSNVSVAKDCYEASNEAHAVAVLTEWDEFKNLNFQTIRDSMHQPAFIFDGRNILNRNELARIGFEIHGIGKPTPSV